MNTPTFPLRALPVLVAAALASPLSWAQSAPAADAERASLTELRNTTTALIEALVEQGLLSRARADELLKKTRPVAEATASATAPAAPVAAAPRPNVQRVPYIPESTKAQIKEEIRNDVLATAREEGWADARRLPGWLRSLNFEGDLRVRAQADLLDNNNIAPEIYRAQTDSPSWSPDLTNTQHDRARMTLRARLGVTAKPSDTVSGAVRLSTTSGKSSSSTQTLGNNNAPITVNMDRAWVRWEPAFGVRLDAGRMAMPFDHTDLLFPDDMPVDGVAAKGELDLASGLYGFANAGVFPLQEFEATQRDKLLIGGQMGLDWALDSQWQLRGAVAMYNFRNIEGVRESELPPTGALAGTTGYQSSAYPSAVRLKGNTLINLNAPASTAAPVWGLASKFKPVDLTFNVVAKHFVPYELGFSVDYVKNTGFDLQDIIRRAGTTDVSDLAERTQGYQFKLDFGSPKLQEIGDWTTFFAVRKFERDAWVDAYTDTTWNLGGTNYKGYSLGGQYAFDRRTTLGLRYTSTQNLDDHRRYVSGGATVANLSSAPLKIDVFQLDVNLRF